MKPNRHIVLLPNDDIYTGRIRNKHNDALFSPISFSLSTLRHINRFIMSKTKIVYIYEKGREKLTKIIKLETMYSTRICLNVVPSIKMMQLEKHKFITFENKGVSAGWVWRKKNGGIMWIQGGFYETKNILMQSFLLHGRSSRNRWNYKKSWTEFSRHFLLPFFKPWKPL